MAYSCESIRSQIRANHLIRATRLIRETRLRVPEAIRANRLNSMKIVSFCESIEPIRANRPDSNCRAI